MMTSKRFARILTLTAACLFSVGAQGALIAFTDQAAFLAAVSAPASDTFDDLPQNIDFVGPIPRVVASYRYAASVVPSAGSSALFYDVGPAGDTWLSTNNSADSIRFSAFSANVAAIGGFFFGTDFDGIPFSDQSVTVVAVDGSGTTSQTLVNTTAGTFLGFLSTDRLFSLTITGDLLSSSDVFPTVNDLVLAALPGARLVPEPGPLGLLGLGATTALVSSCYRRRRGPRCGARDGPELPGLLDVKTGREMDAGHPRA